MIKVILFILLSVLEKLVFVLFAVFKGIEIGGQKVNGALDTFMQSSLKKRVKLLQCTLNGIVFKSMVINMTSDNSGDTGDPYSPTCGADEKDHCKMCLEEDKEEAREPIMYPTIQEIVEPTCITDETKEE